MKKDDKKVLPTALDVLQGLLEKGNTPLAEDFKRYRLKLDWAKVVGPTLADKCSPVAFSNGILYIWVTSAPWMNQLFYVRRELVKKINDYAGRSWVKDIRLTQDKKDIPTEAESLK
jgi:predicted nucleic acid-binding Zn ribbon protein